MATTKCPLCAEEVPAGAAFCRYCGAQLRGGKPVGDQAPLAPLVEAPAPRPLPPVPAAALQGEMRESAALSRLQSFGFHLERIVIILTALVTVLGYGGWALSWGETGGASGHPAPVFIIGIIIIAIAWGRGARTWGGKSLTLEGASTISKTAVVVAVLWAVLEVSAILNYRNLVDGGWTVLPGMYAALVLPVVGILAALLILWPDRSRARTAARG